MGVRSRADRSLRRRRADRAARTPSRAADSAGLRDALVAAGTADLSAAVAALADARARGAAVGEIAAAVDDLVAHHAVFAAAIDKRDRAGRDLSASSRTRSRSRGRGRIVAQ